MNVPRFLLAAALGAVLAISTLPAQTATSGNDNRFIPANSSLVLRFASPAKWRKQFATTQVAKLMQGSTLAPMIDELAQGFDSGMEKLRDSGTFDADLAKGLLEDWQGDIVVSLQVDMEGLAAAMDFGEVPPLSFVVAMTSDGSFDLGAVATEFEKMVEKTRPAGATLRDLTVGDLTLRCTDNDGDEPDVCLPFLVDGHLVMIGGNKLEADAAKLISADDRYAQKTAGSPMFLHVDVAPLMKAVMESAGGAGGPVDAAELLEMMGLGAITGLDLKLDADEQHVTGEVMLGMKATNRGLFAMFTGGQKAPRLLRSVPANAESFSVGTMNMAPAYDTIANIWQALADVVPITFNEAMEGFAEATKVRLKEDLIDHLGNEVLMVQDVAALMSADPADLEENPAAMFTGSVFGISLQNGKAFGESLETALRSRGMHVGRKSEDYGTAKVNRMRIAGLVEIEYVVTDDLLLIGIGGDEGTQRSLRNVLDTRAAGESELPETVKKHVAEMAAGWNGISVTQLSGMLNGIVAALEQTGEMDEQLGMVKAIVNGLSQDMKRLGIDSMVSTTYCDDKGLISRFRW